MLNGRYIVTYVLIPILFGTCLSQLYNRRRFGQTPFIGHSSSKARVSLTCGGEDITVNLNFLTPFHGLAYAGDKDHRCRLRGDGRTSYVLRVPLNDCGTKHVCPAGTFTNNVTIRYHPPLEREGDEINAIICRYGPRSVVVS